MDTIKTNFGNNLKAIRIAHNLTMNEMAAFLGFKGNSSIAMIESARSTTSFDTLVSISSLFSVSLDWLFGFSPYIYNELIISLREKVVLDLEIGHRQVLCDIVPYEYRNETSRSQFYNIKERANILYLAQYLNYLIDIEPILKSTDEEMGTIEKSLNKAHFYIEGIKSINRRHFKNRLTEYNGIREDILTLLNSDERFIYTDNNERIPSGKDLCLFDIEKQIQNSNRTY